MRCDVYNGFTSRVSYSHKAVLEIAVLRLIELLYLKRTSALDLLPRQVDQWLNSLSMINIARYLYVLER